MAISLLGPLNKVINKTAAEVIDSQIITKMTDIVATFVSSGVEAIKTLTEEKTEDGEDGK